MVRLIGSAMRWSDHLSEWSTLLHVETTGARKGLFGGLLSFKRGGLKSFPLPNFCLPCGSGSSGADWVGRGMHGQGFFLICPCWSLGSLGSTGALMCSGAWLNGCSGWRKSGHEQSVCVGGASPTKFPLDKAGTQSSSCMSYEAPGRSGGSGGGWRCCVFFGNLQIVKGQDCNVTREVLGDHGRIMLVSGGSGGGTLMLMLVSGGGGVTAISVSGGGTGIMVGVRLKPLRHHNVTNRSSAMIKIVAIGRRTRHAVKSSTVVVVVVVVVGISYFHKSCNTLPS